MSHDTDISDERVGPLEALGLDTGRTLMTCLDKN